jgi:hypothetical protein
MKTSTITNHIAMAALGTAVSAGSVGCTYYEVPPKTSDTAADDGYDDGAPAEETGPWEESGGSEDGGEPADCAQVEIDTLNVLQTYCAGCHKPGPNPPGNFDYVIDLERLVLEGKVVPGDSAGSPLFARIDSGQMPPPVAPAFPEESDIAVLEQWIDECLPAGGGGGGAACEPDHRIGIDGMLLAIAADIANPNAVAQENRENIRYLSLSHLYDSGLCGDELAVYRQALAKSLNSLSNGTKIVAPTPVDADETIYRIDLRDYEWDAELWRDLANQSPYAIEYTREEAIDIQAFTNENIPILRGDWLAAIGTAPPYYNTLLLDRIGATSLFDLQVDLLLNINGNIADEIATNADEVARAGFLDSGVSENNRLIERHEIAGSSNRAFWISYDFGSNAGQENLFASPDNFVEAGSEVIFSLPNGLHAYLIVDNAGTRLDAAPNNIVTDPAEPTGEVITGRSCFGCHDTGINFVDDTLGAHVAAGDFDDATKEAIENLHPPVAEFAALQQADADAYAAALMATGVPIAAPEPIGAVFEWYQLSLGLTEAAGEFGITEDELLVRIGGLSADLQPLAYGTIKRNTFELNYAQAVCDLQLGATNACP